jgi:hypothetical protein
MKTARHDLTNPDGCDPPSPPVWSQKPEPPAYELDHPPLRPDDPPAIEEPGYGHGV